uniref:Uncharacterized protein n=1 Tax=Nelumbo nucifera TaxID=4432 RepID=A0A822ZRD3_NELNU|nr:TPA_asm: hypothetical protein HUJ06_003736 [Nelumbo nucifera]
MQSTVDVTPEDGFSYASYEAMGLDPGSVGLEPLLRRVLRCFRPAQFSIAVTHFGGGAEEWGDDVSVEGYRCENVVKQEMPGGGCVLYRCFTGAEKGCVLFSSSPKSILHCWEDVVAEEEMESVVACHCVSSLA